MAKIETNTSENIFQIKNWLGVNEAPEGEARLKQGEAAAMRNFQITAGGALRKRPGSMNVAGLLNSYVVDVDTEVQTLLRETETSTASFTLYSQAMANSVGEIVLSGETVTVTNANADGYVGWYYKDDAGNVWKFAGVSRTSE